MSTKLESESVDATKESLKDEAADRPPLSHQEKVHYAMFTFMYFLQGLHNSYEIISPVYLNSDRGVSASNVSLGLGIARIAIVLRILLALAQDKYNFCGLGHRKPSIFVGVLLTALGFIGLGVLELNNEMFSMTNFTVAYFAIYFFIQLAFTTYDSAADGFITESVPKDRAGQIQGFINGGRGIGTVVGFVGFGILAEDIGWHTVMFAQAGFLMLYLPFVVLLKEVPDDERDQFNWSAFKLFRQRNIQASCFYVFLINIPGAMSLFLLPLFVENELEFSTDDTSIVLAVAAVFVAIGAPCAGWILDRHRSRLQWIFTGALLLGAVSVGGFALSTYASGLVYLFSGVGGAFTGALLVLNFALVMILADNAIAGSFFSVLDTIWTLGEIVALAFVGTLLDATNFNVSFAITVAILLAIVPIFHFMFHDTAGATKDTAVEDVELAELESGGADAESSSSSRGSSKGAPDDGEREPERESSKSESRNSSSGGDSSVALPEESFDDEEEDASPKASAVARAASPSVQPAEREETV